MNRREQAVAALTDGVMGVLMGMQTFHQMRYKMKPDDVLNLAVPVKLKLPFLQDQITVKVDIPSKEVASDEAIARLCREASNRALAPYARIL